MRERKKEKERKKESERKEGEPNKTEHWIDENRKEGRNVCVLLWTYKKFISVFL